MAERLDARVRHGSRRVQGRRWRSPSLAAVNYSKGLAMSDEIAALRREMAELRQALSGLRARVELLELREQLARMQRGPLYVAYAFLRPDGRAWAASYCAAAEWAAIAAAPGVRALSPFPVGMQEASDTAAQLELCYNRLAGIEDLPRC